MSLSWHETLNDLVILLAGLYPERDKARFVMIRAGVSPDDIDFSGSPRVIWLRAVEEANKRDKVRALINVVQQDYDNVNLAALEQRLQQPSLAFSAPPITEVDWKAPPIPASVLEKVIGAQPTFLPVSFLEIGLLRARAVARVETPEGVGTGFLIRNNLLITNNHVIPKPEHAAKTKVWFNFQKTATGTDAPVEEYTLDPTRAFATSSMERGDDWTAVAVKGDTTTWGYLTLSDAGVKTNDFVNIVQHPSGLPKQIALYHNVVVYADHARVQYLTDTEPGSSGSPVFDSSWSVVALHHSGGYLAEPSTGKIYFRNEGIHVQALIRGLRDHGLYGG
jgi:hypothetical protein